MTTGAGPTPKTVTVHIGKDAVLKRYASTSVRFADAQPASFGRDSCRRPIPVLGRKTQTGRRSRQPQVVSGSFRNISGLVSLRCGKFNFDSEGSGTKKSVTVHITPDADMRRLPDMMAKMIAARLKGTAPAGGAGGGTSTVPARAAGRTAKGKVRSGTANPAAMVEA